MLDVSRAHFRPNSRRELYTRLPTADSKPGHVGKLLRSLCGMRDAVNAWDECCNIAPINKGTKLDCHHHACTYGSDVARSDGQKQVGPSPSWTKHGRRISLQRAIRVKQEDPALPTVSCGSMVAYRSTPWLDLTCC